MEKINKEIIVNTSIEKVFKYVENPINWLEFWPSIIDITDLQPLPDGGYRAKFEYKMAGRRFKGEGKFTDYAPNNWFVVTTKGGISSKITFTFRTFNEKLRSSQTRVTLTIEYTIPIPLLGKIAEIVIRKMNDQEIELVMANLRARFLVNY
ncbi:MAG TPA: SRPBCC family protein [Dehalococcoidia bacterium]|nr:SRPBCC family protein [Dehalococcoidia bacterium]